MLPQIVLLIASLCLVTSFALADNTAAEEPPLRPLADRIGLHFGTAVDVVPLRDAPSYRAVLVRDFNTIVAEKVMKFGRLCPQPGGYDFTDADTLMDFARDHGMAVRGHVPVWHRVMPTWLVSGDFPPEQVKEILKTHIQTIVGRYRGRIYAWDVVNEAFEDFGPKLRDSFWLKKLGPDYIAWAFRWAHEADPDARLFYNDFLIEGTGEKTDAMFALVTRLRAEGVPIHGVGLQLHLENHLPEGLAENIARLRAAGLEVHSTEIDVRLKQPASAADLARQADIYRELLALALNTPDVLTFMMWGFTDRVSWIPGEFSGMGTALIRDENFQPKPAFNSLRALLETRAAQKT